MKSTKIEHKPKCCPICRERFMNIHGQPLPNHSQVKCQTQNGDELEIGICNNCIVLGVSIETINDILEGIKEYWVHEIDTDKSLNNKDKKDRKAFHNKHKIVSTHGVRHTGKDAEKQAKKMGKLL